MLILLELYRGSRWVLICDVRWRWLGQLKQPDGGFSLSVSGEEDVRYEIPILRHSRILQML